MDKICCVTGHRPSGFPWNYYLKHSAEQAAYLSALKKTVLSLMQNGYNYFISGGAIGVDQDFAEIILELKKSYPSLKLEIAVPCPGQDAKWSLRERMRYKSIIDKADSVTLVSDFYNDGCMHKRNRYMVDKSSVVIAVWNEEERGGTYNTIKYALSRNIDVNYIKLTKQDREEGKG